jgi:hypothetical protein
VSNGCAALRGRSLVATHIEASFACRRRLLITICDSVGDGAGVNHLGPGCTVAWTGD